MHRNQHRLVHFTTILITGVGLVIFFFWFISRPALAEYKTTPSSTFSLEPSSPEQAPMIIPLAQNGITLDGNCDSGIEYADALALDFADAGGVTGTVYLMHNSDNLFVCMVGAQGTYASRYGRVYLDTDNGQEAYSGPEDYGLQVTIEDSSISRP